MIDFLEAPTSKYVVLFFLRKKWSPLKSYKIYFDLKRSHFGILIATENKEEKGNSI